MLNKNVIEKKPLPPSNTDALLGHILEHGNTKAEEASRIAENHLEGVDRTNMLLENGIEAHGQVIDEQKKTNEKLDQIVNKDVQNVKLVPENIDPDESSRLALMFWEMLRGRKGAKGDSPTKEELIKIITPLIPDPIKGDKGDSPSEEDLLALIIPLIPEVKDGHTPTTEELLALIKPLIPNPIPGDDGHTPTREEIMALIRELMPKIPEMPEIPKFPTIDEIAEALKTKIKWEHIADRPNVELFAGLRGGGPGYIKEISDVAIGADEPADGAVLTYSRATKKYSLVVPTNSGGGGSFAFETPVGAINSSNNTYSVSNIPKAIVLNGTWYFENDGYTRSGLVITMVITPETGSTLRSAY